MSPVAQNYSFINPYREFTLLHNPTIFQCDVSCYARVVVLHTTAVGDRDHE